MSTENTGLTISKKVPTNVTKGLTVAQRGVRFVGQLTPVKNVVNTVQKTASDYIGNIIVNSVKDKAMECIYSIEGLSAPDVTVTVREFLYRLDAKTYDKYAIEPALDESAYTTVKPLDPCLYVIRKKHATMIVHGRYVPNVYDKSINAFRTDIYIIGKKRKKYKKAYDKMHDAITKRLTTGDNISVHLYDGRGTMDSIQHRKTIDSMVISEKTKDAIITKIERFLGNKDAYLEHEITYKLGILLYGDPGTGKTSLAKSIACTYDCELAVINVNDILQFKDYSFSNARRKNDKMIVVLLEDIDCVLNAKDDRYGSGKEYEDEYDEDDDYGYDTHKKKGKVIKGGSGSERLHALLQILDGTNSSNNVIYIATTNFVDRLDEALTRDGRFDLKVEMKNFDQMDAYELASKFNFNEEETDKILKNRGENNFPINPAKLQNILMDEFTKTLK